jgi:hypothetical protein
MVDETKRTYIPILANESVNDGSDSATAALQRAIETGFRF